MARNHRLRAAGLDCHQANEILSEITFKWHGATRFDENIFHAWWLNELLLLSITVSFFLLCPSTSGRIVFYVDLRMFTEVGIQFAILRIHVRMVWYFWLSKKKKRGRFEVVIERNASSWLSW